MEKSLANFQDFNSTMVRLKDGKGAQQHGQREFQFHYGTIKSSAVSTVPLTLNDFNSTMVRLKVSARRAFIFTCHVFQFHYGTIKSGVTKKDVSNRVLFQFHYGTIKSADAGQSEHEPHEFQFHYGTIKSG